MKNYNGSLRKRFFLSAEGSIFIIGNILLILWLSVIVLMFQFAHPLWLNILTMGFTQLIGGRAASIAQGTQTGIHPLLIAFIATYIDTLFVFLFYPILVFSYRNFFERRFFQKHMKPIFDSAQKGLFRFSHYKIISVFLFVWFPFWMTGVIIGSVLGYLLGLKSWTTMITVIFGTMSAAFCWVYFYDKLYSSLGQVNKGIPVILTILIIIGLAVYRIVTRPRKLDK